MFPLKYGLHEHNWPFMALIRYRCAIGGLEFRTGMQVGIPYPELSELRHGKPTCDVCMILRARLGFRRG